MKKTILIVLMALAPVVAQGQLLSNYTVTTEQGEWRSIAQTGTLLPSVIGDYNGLQTLALPFNFQLGSLDLPAGSLITVRSDGFVVLRGSASNENPLNYWNSAENSMISPFMLFDGLMPAGQGGCWWQTMDDSVNGGQMLVIEFRHVQHYARYPISTAEAANDDFNYQLRLHENGDVSCVYGRMHNGVSSDTLFNFIMTDGSSGYDAMYDIDHVALRGTWAAPVASTWQPGYRSGNNWIISATSNPTGLPDSGQVITWHRPLPPCPRPSAVVVSQIGHDTAVLSWVENDVAGAYYIIQYDTVDFTPGGTGHNMTYWLGDTMPIYSLAPNHQYWLYMRSNCGEDSSDWVGVTFHTLCVPLAGAELPFEEDFESYSNFSAVIYDHCWDWRGVQFNVRDEGSAEPNKALLLHQAGMAMLPPVDSLRNKVLTFDLKSNNEMDAVIGVLEDVTDMTTFVPIRTYSIASSQQNSWINCQVPFGQYTGEGTTIAIRRVNTNGSFGWLWVDNVTVDYFSGCLSVDAVSVSEVGKHSARVDWSDFLQTGSYRVECVSAMGGPVTIVNTTADSVTLTGLMANTPYVVRVYSLCTDSTESEPMTATFHTRCAVPLPLYEDFESLSALPDCWKDTSMREGFGSLPPTPLLSTLAGNTDLRFSSTYTDIYHYERGILMLPFVDTTVNRLRMTFDYRAERFPTVLSMIVGVIPGDNDLENFLPVATIYPIDTMWHTYTVETGAVPFDEGRLVMMQHSTTPRDYVAGYLKDLGHVDNIYIDTLPYCDRPAAVWVTDITSSSALVHWQENNTIGTYEVACDGSVYTVTGDTLLTIVGLTHGREQMVSVRKLCDNGYTSYRSCTFQTACEPVTDLPWFEDFEAWGDNTFSLCWLRHYGGIQGSEVVAVNSFFYNTTTGSKTLRMTATNIFSDQQAYDAIAVLPYVDRALDELSIGFSTRMATGSGADALLELGVMSDGGDSTTFRPLDTIAVSSSWSYYEHTFATGDSGRVALRLKALQSGPRVIIDDVSIFVATGCTRPEGLTVDTVTQHTATVTIADSNGSGHYRLYWHQPLSTITDSMDVDSTTAVITGLAASTAYVIHAAARCGNDLSNIVSAELTTDCDTLTHNDLPYTETFSSGRLSHCWGFLPVNADVQVNEQRLMTAIYPGNHPIVVMPVVDTLAGIDLTFSAQLGFYGEAVITVGVLANPQDAASFVPVVSYPAQNVWTDYQVSFADHSDIGHHIAFRFDNPDTSWSTMVYLDNVTLSQSLPCAKPDSVIIDSCGATSALITIADHHDNRHYRLLLSSIHGTSVHFVDFSSTDSVYHVALDNLIPATEYTINAASVCYDSSITFSVQNSFVTGCAPLPLPWRQDFEAEAVNRLPRCWELPQGSGRVFSGTAACSGEQGLIVSSPDSLSWVDLYTPELAFGTDSTRIVFYVTASQGYTDTAWHYHQLPTRLQLYAAATDSLILLHDDTVSNYWRLVSLPTAPLPYGARLLFRFWHTAGATGYQSASIDDLLVRMPTPPPACNAITDIAVSDISYTGATVSWTPQGDENRWMVHLRGEGTNLTTVVDSTTVIFPQLSHSTTYAFLVRPLCSDTLSGPWSDTVLFTTTGCLPASNIAVTSTTTTTATVQWTAGDGQTRWVVNYGEQGFSVGQGYVDTLDISFQPFENVYSHILTGLEPETEYDLYIRTLCDEGMQSVWSDRVSFTTTLSSIRSDLQSPTTDITVHPNPASDQATLDGLPADAVVTLLDARGSRRLTATAPAEGRLSIDCRTLPSGVYFIVVEDKCKKKVFACTKKLVILHPDSGTAGIRR